MPSCSRWKQPAILTLAAAGTVAWLGGDHVRTGVSPVELAASRHPIYRELQRQMDRLVLDDRRQKRLMRLGEDEDSPLAESASPDGSGHAHNLGHDWDPCEDHDLTKCEPRAPAESLAGVQHSDPNVFADWDEDWDDEGWQGRGTGQPSVLDPTCFAMNPPALCSRSKSARMTAPRAARTQ
jgi:hypothetical protein